MMHSDTVHSFIHFVARTIRQKVLLPILVISKLIAVSEAYSEPSRTSSTLELSCENI